MQPTNKLRFVERKIDEIIETGDNYEIAKTVTRNVLQQWWAAREIIVGFDDNGTPVKLKGGEWRDVPLETESD